jgi:hypothetical protein
MSARRPARGHKYHAQRTVYNEVRYASKAEAAYAQRLDLLVAAGEVWHWEPYAPPTWPLVVLQAEPRITYRPDFWVLPVHGGRSYLVEVKGFETAVWRLKRKLYIATQVLPLLVVYGKGREEWVIPHGATRRPATAATEGETT